MEAEIKRSEVPEVTENFADQLRVRLFAKQDPGYKAFMEKLLPPISADTIIGVRLPALKKLAAELAESENTVLILRNFPHFYLEENHLHSFLIDRLCSTYEDAMRETEAFLPFIDNWAVCDSFRPKALRQNLPALYGKIMEWLESREPYTIRFGLVLLLNWFLEEEFQPDMLNRAAAIQSDEYYVRMAVSWFFSMALAKQYEAALSWFESSCLPVWIHNKAIQKAVESRQLSVEKKNHLKTLKC